MATRTEKFKSYRDEIKRMDDTLDSSRTIVSQKVDDFIGTDDYKKIRDMTNSTLSISYNEILETANSMGEESSPRVILTLPPFAKKVVFYVSMSIIMALLAALIIYLAIQIWVIGL